MSFISKLFSADFLLGLVLGALCSVLVLLSQFAELEVRFPVFPSSSWSSSNSNHNDGQYCERTTASRIPRIYCWILTAKQFHRERSDSVEASWARQCDKHLFMSSAEDSFLPAVDLKVPEGREFLWAKTKASFEYIYERENLSAFDWFLKADDDTFVLVDNLRLALLPYSPNSLLYFGCTFHFMDRSLGQTYMSGGAGYVLSRAALRKFVEHGLRGQQALCNSSEIYEDLEMGSCMRRLNVTVGDSRDSLGRHRFLPLSPDRSLVSLPEWHPDTWVSSYTQFPYEPGPNCCSDWPISFHYIKPTMMRTLHFLVSQLKVHGKQSTTIRLSAESALTLALANLGPNDQNVSASPFASVWQI